MKWLGDGQFTFAHPWLLLLLLALPVLAMLQGGRGAAPAVIFSSLRPLAAIGKQRRSRAHCFARRRHPKHRAQNRADAGRPAECESKPHQIGA